MLICLCIFAQNQKYCNDKNNKQSLAAVQMPTKLSFNVIEAMTNIE